MDVLIKDMKMPEIGHTVTITIVGSGEAYVEYYDCNSPLEETIEYKAISVPPHGRLGDLDRLESNLRNMAKYQSGYHQQGILGCCETIRLTPAIIPESEESET